MSHRVAIAGAGIGARHLDAYLALQGRFQVTHICDLDLGRAQAQASRTEAIATTDLNTLLKNPQIDIIDNCLPPALHAPTTLAALRAGKHVIVEKPVAGSVKETEQLMEAEKTAAPCRVFPVFQYRFGKALHQLAAQKQAGMLGRPVSASLETHWNRGPDYYAARPWRGHWAHEPGGAVVIHAIHIHDLLTLAFGPVAEVAALTATAVNPIETEDCAALCLRMANGALATSSITLGAATDTSRLRLIYEHMTVESTQLAYCPGEADWRFTAREAARQSEVDHVLAALPTPEQQGFSGLFQAIADALDGHPGAAPILADGLVAMELATAIYHSARTGGRVALPVDRRLPICASLAP